MKSLRRLRILGCMFLVVAAVAISGVGYSRVLEVHAAKPSLSKKQVTITIGKSRKVTLKNAKSKVKWKIVKGKKLVTIKTTGKNKSIVKIKARKKGSAKIRAIYKGKKYYINIKVNKKKNDAKSPQKENQKQKENQNVNQGTNQSEGHKVQNGNNGSTTADKESITTVASDEVPNINPDHGQYPSEGETVVKDNTGRETENGNTTDSKFNIYVGYNIEEGELIFSNKESDVISCDANYGQINHKLDYATMDWDYYYDELLPQWIADYGDRIYTVEIKTEIYPYDISKWFHYCSYLSEIKGMKNLNTSYTEMAYKTFIDCRSLTELDVTGFDTRNIRSMECMFYRCMNLTELDVSSFDTRNVTNFTMMFGVCWSLEKLIWSDNFVKTGEETEAFNMFVLCPKELVTPEWCIR